MLQDEFDVMGTGFTLNPKPFAPGEMGGGGGKLLSIMWRPLGAVNLRADDRTPESTQRNHD